MPPRDPHWKPRSPKAPAGSPIQPAPATPYDGRVLLAPPRYDPLRMGTIVAAARAAGADILVTAALDGNGCGWRPASGAQVARGPLGSDSWTGTFDAGGKRFAVTVRLDYGEAPETALEGERIRADEAERDAQVAADGQHEAEETARELRDDLKAAQRDAERFEGERDDLRAKNDAWFDTVYEATAGDGGAAVREAAKIPSEYKP